MSTVNLRFEAGKNKEYLKRFILGEAEYALAGLNPATAYTLDLEVRKSPQGYCCELCLHTPEHKVIRQVRRSEDFHTCVRDSARAFKQKLSGHAELAAESLLEPETHLN